MGRHTGSFTEQQTKQTVATAILIRRIYETNSRNGQRHPPPPTLHAP